MTLLGEISAQERKWEEPKKRTGPAPRRGPGPNQGTRIHHRSFVAIVLCFPKISTVIRKIKKIFKVSVPSSGSGLLIGWLVG